MKKTYAEKSNYMNLEDLKKIDIQDVGTYEYGFFDNYEYESYIETLMNFRKYNHFLVFAFNCRWNGSNGWSIVDDYKKCFQRDYDTSMYYNNGSSTGKWFRIMEYSHDVPTGGLTYIVGLTDKDYERLESGSYGRIKDFLERKCGVDFNEE